MKVTYLQEHTPEWKEKPVWRTSTLMTQLREQLEEANRVMMVNVGYKANWTYIGAEQYRCIVEGWIRVAEALPPGPPVGVVEMRGNDAVWIPNG